MNFDEQSLQRVREGRLLIGRYDDWLFEEFKPYLGQRILEIGCGLGNLLSRFTERELVVGTETFEPVVNEAQDRFRDFSNIQVVLKDITQPEIIELEPMNFDTVISLNVFEHIEDDILAMQNSKRLLRSGGHLILIVPSHQILYGEMDRSIGHYRRYTKAMMQEKLHSIGMKITQQKYVNMLGAVGWWFNGSVLRQKTPPEGQLKFFNYLVPTLRIIEKIAGAPFGISLFSVSTKE